MRRALIIAIALLGESTLASAEQQAALPSVTALATCESLDECSPAQALVTAGKSSTPALLEGLKSLDPKVRFWSTGVLSLTRDPLAVPGLTEAAGDAEIRVRGGAIHALGQIATPDCLPPALRAIQDRDPNVRFQATLALTRLTGTQAEDALIAALSDKDYDVRAYAALGLSTLRCERALPRLARLLRDRNFQVRAFAIEALTNLDAKEAAKPFAQLLGVDRDWRVRAAAAYGLASLGVGSEQVLEALGKAAKGDDNGDVRHNASAALRTLGAGAARPKH